jgi:uncharacterized protein YecT (DUF1311 family)
VRAVTNCSAHRQHARLRGAERFIAVNRRLATILAFLLPVSCGAARAQQPCEFFSDQAREHFTSALQAAPSCKEAAALFDKCRWGSSADINFGSIVMDKCNKELLPQLSDAGKANYQHELSLCSYEFAKQQGTIFISEEMSCQVRAATDFDATPEIANQPPARAGFDCAKTQTAIEQAICSDPKLGDADIVLSRALHSAMSALHRPQQRALADQEMQWFQEVQTKCALGPDEVPPPARDCMRRQFEQRFRELDSCSVGETAACLKLPSADHEQ